MSRTSTGAWPGIVRFVRREGREAGVPCHLCGGARGPIDYRTQAEADREAEAAGQWWLIGVPRPLSLHVDHIVPHSAGGADSLDNAAASHRVCNESAGAKRGSGAGGRRPEKRPRRAPGQWRPIDGKGPSYAGLDVPGKRTSTHVFVAGDGRGAA